MHVTIPVPWILWDMTQRDIAMNVPRMNITIVSIPDGYMGPWRCITYMDPMSYDFMGIQGYPKK